MLQELNMKGDPIRPKPIVLGQCFICLKPCEAYCHLECALAMSEERSKRLKEANELTNQGLE